MKKITLTLLVLACALCCALGLAACGGSNPEKTLQSIEYTTPSLVAVRDTYGDRIYIKDGEKLQVSDIKYKTSNGIKYVDTYNEYVFYKDGGSVQCAYRSHTFDQSTSIDYEALKAKNTADTIKEYGNLISDFGSKCGSYRAGAKADIKKIDSTPSTDTLNGAYEAFSKYFDISAEKCSVNMIDYYKEKGRDYKLASENLDDGSIKILIQIMSGGGYAPAYSWVVKDKKLVLYVTGGGTSERYYDYAAHTVTVPEI